MTVFFKRKTKSKILNRSLLAGFTTLLAASSAQANPWLDTAPFEVILSESLVIQNDGSSERDDHFIAGAVNISDSEYVIAVTMQRSLSKNSFYFVGVNSLTGKTTWTKSVPKQVRLSGIDSAENGSFIVVGTIKSDENKDDLYIGKFDKEGQLIWDQTAGGSSDEKGLDVAIDDSGDIYTFGLSETNSAGKKDAWISKFNTTGELIWEKKFGGKKSEGFNSGIILRNGNILAGGYSKTDTIGGIDYYVVEVNTDGDLIRERKIGTKRDENIKTIHESKSGDIYIGGAGSHRNFYSTFAKLNKDLDQEWAWISKDEFSRQTEVLSISEFSNGDILFMSNTNYLSEKSSHAVRVKASGTKVWDEEFKGRNFKSIVDIDVDSLVTAGLRYVNGKASPNFMWVKPYSSREERAREGAKQARYRAQQENSKDTWGAVFGSALRVTTGALVQSGAIEDADTLAYVSIANAAANAATAEQQGKSYEQIQRDTNQTIATTNSQIYSQSDKRVAELEAETALIRAENEKLRLEMENQRLRNERTSVTSSPANETSREQPRLSSNTVSSSQSSGNRSSVATEVQSQSQNSGTAKIFSHGLCKRPLSIKLNDGSEINPETSVIKKYTVGPLQALEDLEQKRTTLVLSQVEERECVEAYVVPESEFTYPTPGKSTIGKVGKTHGAFSLSSEEVINHRKASLPEMPTVGSQGEHYYIWYDDKSAACSKVTVRNADVSGLSESQRNNSFVQVGIRKAVENFNKHCR